MTGILPNISSYQYIVLGDPTPLSRARIKLGGRGVYDPQKQEKLAFGLVLRTQQTAQKHPILTGPLHLILNFYFAIPPSRHKTREGDFHHIRPDLDNLIKFVLDSANTVLFKDDAQIASITASKRYDHLPRTEVIIRT